MLVGPDNGLLIPAAERLGIDRVYEISSKKFLSKRASNVFHGRDIFAPVAAYLSKGVKPSEMGTEVDKYVPFEQGSVTVREDRLEGRIIYIDQFGNLITNIPARFFTDMKWGEKVNVRLGGRTMALRFLQSYGFADAGELLLTISSFNLLEIAINKENASQKLSAVADQNVSVMLL